MNYFRMCDTFTRKIEAIKDSDTIIIVKIVSASLKWVFLERLEFSLPAAMMIKHKVVYSTMFERIFENVYKLYTLHSGKYKLERRNFSCSDLSRTARIHLKSISVC